MGNAGSWRTSASRTLLPPTGMQSLTSCRSASRFWATRSTSPIDEKPKRRPVTALKRLRNIAENPAVAVIVDRYEEDWTRLGWVMLRGRAEVLSEGQEHRDAQALLRSRYPQLAAMQIADYPVIAVRIERATSWGDLTPGAAR